MTNTSNDAEARVILEFENVGRKPAPRGDEQHAGRGRDANDNSGTYPLVAV